MAIDPTTGLVTWTPTASQVGSPHVEITASDNRGASTTQFFDLPVVATAPDDPPTITSTPARVDPAGGHVPLPGRRHRPRRRHADLLAADAARRHDHRPDSGLVTWKPTAAQLGANPVAGPRRRRPGRVRHPDLLDQRRSRRSVNHPPTITSNPPQAATVGKLYAYDLEATDPDNDPLVWSLDAAPGGHVDRPDPRHPPLDADGRPARRSRTSSSASSTARAGSPPRAITITVRAVNLPPAITSAPPTTADTARAYTYAVRATDPEDDPLTFQPDHHPRRHDHRPETGFIQWTPDATQVGSPERGHPGRRRPGRHRDPDLHGRRRHRGDEPAAGHHLDALACRHGRQPYSTRSRPPTPRAQALTYVLLVKPDGMAIDASTGLVTWTPTLGQLGPNGSSSRAVDPPGAGGIADVLDHRRPGQPPARPSPRARPGRHRRAAVPLRRPGQRPRRRPAVLLARRGARPG